MADLEFIKVNKIYSSGVHALKDVSFRVGDGEFVVIVGPSGCGKTTVLRLIAGLEELTGGEILLGGESLAGVRVKDRNLAMVFQNYALYPHMSVYDNMALGLRLRGKRAEADVRVREVAEMLGLSECLDRRPGQLSGGQKQRTALGRAIISQPRLFLFDEPLSNLDPSLRSETRRELTALHQKLKTTFIYVTHDKTEAMTMADRLIVMNDGRIVQNDTPINVYSMPADTFTARFMDPDMNFIKGELQGRDGKRIVKTDLFELIFPKDYGSDNEEFTVGIRETDLSLTPICGGVEINGTLIAEENLGDGIRLTVLTKNGIELLVSGGKETGAKRGEGLRLWLDPKKALLFDKEQRLIR